MHLKWPVSQMCIPCLQCPAFKLYAIKNIELQIFSNEYVLLYDFRPTQFPGCKSNLWARSLVF